MRQIIFIACFSLCLTGGLSGSAQNVPAPELLLGAAIHQEEAEGNLDAAIAGFKKVIADQRASRAVTASALIHLARCYEKLGSSEAQKLYERVSREFSDQKEAAAEARTRLSAKQAARTSGGMAMKRIWAGPDVDPDGNISPDGRYLSYVDWTTGDLAVRELAKGVNRRLTKESMHSTREFVLQSAFSRDGKQIAYARFNFKDQRFSLWTIDFDGAAPARQIYDNEDIAWLGPYDWSPDGKWIAVQIGRRDRTNQIALIGARDGSLQVLTTTDWRGASKVLFSPDGKFLAFDMVAADSGPADIYVLSADGSRRTVVVESPANEAVMGWAPDGSQLLFTSDRAAGPKGLWSVPMADGKPQGNPALIRTGIDGYPLGVSNQGKLYYAFSAGDRDIRIASVDFASGKQIKPAVSISESYFGANQQPDWSADGEYLAYISGRDVVMGKSRVMVIRSMKTGAIRELPVQMDYFNWPRWAPDNASFVTYGRDFKGRQGIFRVDVQSGHALPILVANEDSGNGTFGPEWSPDGRHIYYRHFLMNNTWTIVARDVLTGEERELIRRPRLGAPAVSPKGDFVAVTTGSSSNSARSGIVLIPAAAGEARELFQAADDVASIGWLSWTPDGSAIIANIGIDQSGKRREVWIIPVNGSSPRKAEIRVSEDIPIRVHPDGRQVAFVAGEVRFEVWALENFLGKR